MYPAFLPTLFHSSFVDFPSVPWTLQGFPTIGALDQLFPSPMILFFPLIFTCSASLISTYISSLRKKYSLTLLHHTIYFIFHGLLTTGSTLCVYIHRWLSSKESACNSIPGSGRSPREGNGNPLQYSCLEKSHGQRSLAGYSPWGRKRVGHNWGNKQQQCM